MEHGYEGDLLKTQHLVDLFAIPAEQRDDAWRQLVLADVDKASFRCGQPQVIQGPDEFPYFALYLPEPGKAFQCYVIEHMKNDFLLEHGLGVVIHPDKQQPDWVFTYGDIVNYHLNGEFYTAVPEHMLAAEEVIEQDEQVLVGQPAEEYLPAAVRKVMRQYLASENVPDPKIFLMMRHMKDGSTMQELVFNLSRELFASPGEHHRVMQRLGWFLPRHYSILSFDKNDRYEDVFMPL
jgi:hypothetical protein